MDWDTALAGILGVLGGGVGKAVVDGYNARKSKLLEITAGEEEHENKKEDATIAFLAEALRFERAAHLETLTRLSALEKRNLELQQDVIRLRDTLLASYAGDQAAAKRMLSGVGGGDPEV